MEYRKLGNTDIDVSLICLGTMTWGEQNDKLQAYDQMDYALEHGVNFFDTAEMYPVPPVAETQGRTEEIIGKWLQSRRCRDTIVLATKVTGKSDGFLYIRDEQPRLNRKHIMAAIDASLARLQTDYVDLYQLHWPDRKTNFFGQLGYDHDPEDEFIPLLEILEVMGELVKAGKVRHIGISNETPWGMAECLRLADKHGLPRVMSIQNPYNLLNRTFEIGLAEMAIREQCGLLAYSPLAFGVLTGKYMDGERPAASRLSLFTRFQRYTTALAETATKEYAAIAKKHGLNMAQMALAYVNSRPFVTSNIIGATTMEQLDMNVKSIDVTLAPEALSDIEAVQRSISNPCP
jgi:aryl-alcohol dehydrogenase-like predicted oxidoreductase